MTTNTKAETAGGTELEIGAIYEGKVTGITKFGAFVALPNTRSGMVHISEVANTYVNDIREHLQEGQAVTVKIINVDKENRLNLSIKKAVPQPAPQPQPQSQSQSVGKRQESARFDRRKSRENLTFDDKLKAFLQDSESKISDLKHHIDKKGGTSRRGRPR